MNLPPGDTGLPLLGETLAFLKNGFDFVESRARKHGPIFRTRILGRDTAVIVGPDEGHKCPGTDYATYFMKVFIAVLLRGGATWEVPEQDLSYHWGQIPPEPRSGLRVSVVNRG